MLDLVVSWGGVNFIQKSYPNWRSKVIHRNKLPKFCYPEVLSKNFFIQNLHDFFDVTFYTKSNRPNKLQLRYLFYVTLSMITSSMITLLYFKTCLYFLVYQIICYNYLPIKTGKTCHKRGKEEKRARGGGST